MNLRALRVLVGLMDLGTLTDAAHAMNLSQSAASRLLSVLEDELGTPLFAREKRRMVPLPAADALYPEALRILGQVAALPDVVATTHRAAPLRVICQTRLVPGLAVPALAQLATERPDLPIRLEAVPRRELSRRLAAGRHDVAIATLPLSMDEAETSVLGAVPLRVALPRDHPLANAEMLTTAVLSALPYVALDQTTVIRRAVDALLGEDAPPIAIEVSIGAAAYRFVAAGLGFTFADEIAIQPELRDGLALVPWERDIEVRIGAAISTRLHADVAATTLELLAAPFTKATIGKP